jgi:hypothetical protein
MDADADSSLTADTDDRLDVRLGGVDLFRFDGTAASLVNGYDFIGSITTAAPQLKAVGSDTNISLNLVPKGTGVGQIGGYTIPVVLDRDVTQTTVANTSVETTVYSFSVPANTLGSTRMLRLILMGDHLNNSGSEVTSVNVKFGSTTVAAYTQTYPTTSATRRAFYVCSEISAFNATNAQVAFTSFIQQPHGSPVGITGACTSVLQGTVGSYQFAEHCSVAEDSTGALTLAVTVTHDTANANISFRCNTVQLVLF